MKRAAIATIVFAVAFGGAAFADEIHLPDGATLLRSPEMTMEQLRERAESAKRENEMVRLKAREISISEGSREGRYQLIPLGEPGYVWLIDTKWGLLRLCESGLRNGEGLSEVACGKWVPVAE